MFYFITTYSLSSLATHGLNLTQTQRSILQSILSTSQLWVYFHNAGGRVNLIATCEFICRISSFCIWLPARSFLRYCTRERQEGRFGVAAAPVVANVMGAKDLASALSIFWLRLVVPSLVGQPITIALVDYYDNH